MLPMLTMRRGKGLARTREGTIAFGPGRGEAGRPAPSRTTAYAPVRTREFPRPIPALVYTRVPAGARDMPCLHRNSAHLFEDINHSRLTLPIACKRGE